MRLEVSFLSFILVVLEFCEADALPLEQYCQPQVGSFLTVESMSCYPYFLYTQHARQHTMGAT
jgi:hypothetical protein